MSPPPSSETTAPRRQCSGTTRRCPPTPPRSSATYGLVVVGGRATRGGPGLTRAEIERATRDGRPEAVRTTLARLVREARTTSVDEGEFVRRLRLSGVVVRPRWGAGGSLDGTEAVVGYSVGLGGKGETVWFGGGRLGSDLSLPQLRQFWEATPAETAAAADVWRSPGRWGREINAVASEEWRRFSRVLDKAYDALSGPARRLLAVAGRRPGALRALRRVVPAPGGQPPGPARPGSRPPRPGGPGGPDGHARRRARRPSGTGGRRWS